MIDTDKQQIDNIDSKSTPGAPGVPGGPLPPAHQFPNLESKNIFEAYKELMSNKNIAHLPHTVVKMMMEGMFAKNPDGTVNYLIRVEVPDPAQVAQQPKIGIDGKPLPTGAPGSNVPTSAQAPGGGANVSGPPPPNFNLLP